MDATEASLTKIVTAVQAGRLGRAGAIGLRVGKVLGRHNMAEHFHLTIADGQFDFTRDQDNITAEAALDGIHIIRTSVPVAMDAGTVVGTYKSLARVERDFRSIKAIDPDLRPIHHWTETRVRAHVFLRMLAAYLAFHLRQAWAPLTCTDGMRPEPADPVAPARRSAAAQLKASTRTTTDNEPAHSFTGILDHLATMTRNRIHIAGRNESIGFHLVATPTPIQRRAFELIGGPIPINLK